jgi:uncharacterized protein (DUF58 family)
VSARPTKRALAFAGGASALFLVGTNVQAGWVLAIAALLVGVCVIGLVAPLRGSTGIVVGRRAPRTATAGQLIPITITVTNRGSRTRALLSVDDRFCGRGAAVVGMIRPGQTREYVSRRADARRGVHAHGEATIVAAGPFGALRVARSVSVSSPLIVYPLTYDAPTRPMVGLGEWRVPAPIGDTSSVRDYHRGDPLRHVHWRSSARRGELMVREFDTEKRAEVTVVAEASTDADVADAVASAACSLGLALLRSGEVRLIAAGDGAGETLHARDRETVLEWGARLVPGDPSLRAVLERSMSPAVVCVAPAATAGAEALRDVARNSSLLAVLVTDGTTDGLALAAQLRAAGASVATVPASEVDTWFADGCVAS